MYAPVASISNVLGEHNYYATAYFKMGKE